MDKKEVKAYLSQAMYVKQEIDRAEEHLITLRSLREKVTPSYSLAPGGGGMGNKIEDLTVKIIELEEKSKKAIQSYLQQYNSISALISSLKDKDMRYVTVLGLRYLEGNSWNEIASCLHYSRRTVIYLHEQALEEIARRDINE